MSQVGGAKGECRGPDHESAPDSAYIGPVEIQAGGGRRYSKYHRYVRGIEMAVFRELEDFNATPDFLFHLIRKQAPLACGYAQQQSC